MGSSSISFSTLPPLLQKSIVGKRTFEQYAKFCQSSQLSLAICNYFPMNFPIKIHRMIFDKARIIVQHEDKQIFSLPYEALENDKMMISVTDLRVKDFLTDKITNFILKRVQKAHELQIKGPPECPGNVNRILKKINVERLYIHLNWEWNHEDLPYNIGNAKEVLIFNAFFLKKEALFSQNNQVFEAHQADLFPTEDVVLFVKDCIETKRKFTKRGFSIRGSFPLAELEDAIEAHLDAEILEVEDKEWWTNCWRVRSKGDLCIEIWRHRFGGIEVLCKEQ